jgi:hypothetical protein
MIERSPDRLKRTTTRNDYEPPRGRVSRLLAAWSQSELVGSCQACTAAAPRRNSCRFRSSGLGRPDTDPERGANIVSV